MLMNKCQCQTSCAVILIDCVGNNQRRRFGDQTVILGQVITHRVVYPLEPQDCSGTCYVSEIYTVSQQDLYEGERVERVE